MSEFDDRLKKQLESILHAANSEEGAKNALALLFPKAEKALNTYLPSDSGNIKINKLKRRLSQKDFASNYFTLTPTANAWGRDEFENLITEGPNAAFNHLNNKTNRLQLNEATDVQRVFIELLDSAFSSRVLITQEWLDKILAESSVLLRDKDNVKSSFFEMENEDRIRWLIINALSRLSENERAELLKNAIVTANDISVLSDVVRSIAGDLNPEGARDRNSKASLGEHTETVRQLLVDAVRDLAESNEIWDQANPAHILWFWWGANQGNEVLKFTNQTMKTERGLTGLLEAAVSTVVSSEGNYERVSPAWSKIVDLASLTDLAQQLSKGLDGEERKRLALRFLSAVERERKDPS
jgi:hypothetical protein